MTKKGFTSIDEYIAACPEGTHERLRTIRAEIKRLVPDAREKISYQMACFELNGKDLVYFAGWKKHVSLYPIPAGSEAFERQIAKYVDGKGTVKFLLDSPMPIKLVRQLVKYRVADQLRNEKQKRR